MFGEGISRFGELVDLGVKLDIIEKSGVWYTLGELRFQGRDNVKDYLKEHLDAADDLEAQIRRDSLKLMTPQEKAAAKAAGRAVDIDAEDFEG
jgi:recombination protein RecA